MKRMENGMHIIKSTLIIFVDLLSYLFSKIRNNNIEAWTSELAKELHVFILIYLLVCYLLEYLIDCMVIKGVLIERIKYFIVMFISFIIAMILYINLPIFIEMISKFAFYLYLYKLGFTWK